MDLHKRFAQLYHILDPVPREYYARRLIDGLYERGVVSNTPSPIPLPNWDDQADLINIINALNMLKSDIQGMIDERNPAPEIKQFNYKAIHDQLDALDGELNPMHDDAIEIILHGIDNEHRMHWIDDELAEKGLPSTTTIFEVYHINLY